jgi:demethylmenaquinone methyltransferase/2-methoxy-6-polyprenyl-1,4-benzoquinol methylase
MIADTPPDPATAGRAHFGFRDVPEAEKAGLVRRVFESVAPNYDLMNDLMSAGVHRLWKSTMVDVLGPRPGQAIVDVAGGTGDIAFRLVERVGQATPIVVCDINPDMIAVGRDRAIDRGLIDAVRWSVGDAERLPFPDASFDAYTIAFGLRNVTHVDAALREARRVLKPGGKFVCLEFSRVVVPGLDRLYDAYSFNVLPALGRMVAGDAESYRYLAESIRKFPPQDRLVAMMTGAGFGAVRYRNLSGGIAALHYGWRI